MHECWVDILCFKFKRLTVSAPTRMFPLSLWEALRVSWWVLWEWQLSVRMSPLDSKLPDLGYLVAASSPHHNLCINYEIFMLTMVGYYISFISFINLIKFTTYNSSFVYSSFKFLFKIECSLIRGGANCLKMSKVIYKI